MRYPRLSTAVASRVGYLMIQGGSSLAVFALFARALPPEQLDLAAIGLAVYVTVQAVSDLGLSQLTVTEIPRAEAESAGSAAPMSAAAATLYRRLALAALGGVLVAVAVVPTDARWTVALAAPATAASLLVTGAESLARARGDVRAPLGFVIAGRGVFFLLAPLLWIRQDATFAIGLFSVGAVLGALPAWRALSSPPGPVGHRRALLHATLLVGASSALIAVGTRGTVVVLAHAAERGETAGFEAAWRLFQLFVYGAGAVATATAPYAARALGTSGVEWHGRTVVRGAALLGAAGVALGTALYIGASPMSRVLVGRPDDAVADALRILALALPLTYIAYYLQMTATLPLRRFRALLIAGVALCATTLLLTAFLAASEGAAGAAIAVLAGQATLLTILAGDLIFVGSQGSVNSRDPRAPSAPSRR